MVAVRDTLTSVIIDLQINPGVAPWPVIRDAARAAEEAGFGALWTMDHLQGSVMRAPDMPECFSLLGALAAATSSISLGPLVVNVSNRHPGILANAAATVQHVSGGRLLLGLGAGSGPNSPTAAEKRAIGMTPLPTVAQRHSALESALDVIDELWSPERDSKFESFPRPDPAPPILLGVNGEKLARVAGRRTNGVNIRATHDNARSVVTVALDEHRASGRSGPFHATLWDFYDESLLDPRDERRATWESWGVNRLILIMFEEIDVERIRSARRLLAS